VNLWITYVYNTPTGISELTAFKDFRPICRFNLMSVFLDKSQIENEV